MTNKPNIAVKNIIFDLDGTLVHKRPQITHFIQEYLEKHGVTLSEDQVIQSGRWSHKFWEDTATYESDPDRKNGDSGTLFWRNYLHFYDQILDLPAHTKSQLLTELARLIEDKRGEEYLFEDTKQVLSTLKTQGYRMGVLSNRFSSIAPTIERYSLTPFFEQVYSAGELDAVKPNAEIFEKYLKIFDGKPHETLYVGDNYWLDALGAKNAGITPVLLDIFGWYDDDEVFTIPHLSHLIDYLC